MSHLLDQAIIDAEALKEVAMKNDEITILEKFSDQIKEAVEQILDEGDEAIEDLEADTEELEGDEVVDQLSPASAEGVEMCPCPDAEDEEITIDLASLEADFDDGVSPEASTQVVDSEMVAGELGKEAEEEEAVTGGELALETLELNEETLTNIVFESAAASTEFTLEEELLDELTQMLDEDSSFFDDATEEEDAEATTVAAVPGGTDAEASARPYVGSSAASPTQQESLDINEEDLNDIVEEALTVDISPETYKSGWLETPEPIMKFAEEELLAMLQDSERREAHDGVIAAVKKLQESYDNLQLKTEKLDSDKKELYDIANKLKNKLNETNLANARLLYTNKVLMSTSLNERQKNKIVEALSNSENVEEAKVIYETLQSATGSTIKNNKPESLSEVMNKATSTVILSHRKRDRETTSQKDSSVKRWQVLAGLKKTT